MTEGYAMTILKDVPTRNKEMDDAPITLKYNDRELFAVPSIHFSHIFAREVNRLCSHPDCSDGAKPLGIGPTKAGVSAFLRPVIVGARRPSAFKGEPRR